MPKTSLDHLNVEDITNVEKPLPPARCLFDAATNQEYLAGVDELSKQLAAQLKRKYHHGGLGKVYPYIFDAHKLIELESLSYETLITWARILFYGKRASQDSNPIKALRVLRLLLLAPSLTPAQLVEIECFAAFIYFRGDTIGKRKGIAPVLLPNLPMALHCLTRAYQDYRLSVPRYESAGGAVPAESEEPLQIRRMPDYLIFLLAYLEHDLAAKKTKFSPEAQRSLVRDMSELENIWGIKYEFEEGEGLSEPSLALAYLLNHCKALIQSEDQPELKGANYLVKIVSSPEMLQTFLLENHSGGDEYGVVAPMAGGGAGAAPQKMAKHFFMRTLSTAWRASEMTASRLEIILTYVARIVQQKLRERQFNGLSDALLQFFNFGVQLFSVDSQLTSAMIKKIWDDEKDGIEPFVGDAELPSSALQCLLDIVRFHLVTCHHDLSLIQDGFYGAGEFLPQLGDFAEAECVLKQRVVDRRLEAADMTAEISAAVPAQIQLETNAYYQCVAVAQQFFNMAKTHPAQPKKYLELGLRYLLKGFSILENGTINKEMYFRIAYPGGSSRIDYIKRITTDAVALFQDQFAKLVACDRGMPPPLGLKELKAAVAQIGLPVHPLFDLFAHIAGQLKQEVTVYVWMEAFSTVFNLAAMDTVDEALKEFHREDQTEERLRQYRDKVKQIIGPAYRSARTWLHNKYNGSHPAIAQQLDEILADPYNVDAYLKLDDALGDCLPAEQLAEVHLSINLFFSLLYRWKLIDAIPARAGLRIYDARCALKAQGIEEYDPDEFGVAHLRGLIQERKEENQFKLTPYKSVDTCVADGAVQWSEDKDVLGHIIASAETVPVALMRGAFALCRQVYLELELELKEKKQFDLYQDKFAGMWDLIQRESKVDAVRELPQQISFFIVSLKDIMSRPGVDFPMSLLLGRAEQLRDIAQEEGPLWLRLSNMLKEISEHGISQARASRYVRVAMQLQECLQKRFTGQWDLAKVREYCQQTLSGELEKNIQTLSRQYGFDVARETQIALGEFDEVPWDAMQYSTLVDQLSYYRYMLTVLFSPEQKELSCHPAEVCVAIFKQLGNESYGQVLAKAVGTYRENKPMLFAVFDHIHQLCLSTLVAGVDAGVADEFSRLSNDAYFSPLKTEIVLLAPYQKSAAAKFIFDATPGKDLSLLIQLLGLEGSGRTAMRIKLFACLPEVGVPVCMEFYNAVQANPVLQKLWQTAGFAAGQNCLVYLRHAVFNLVKWYSEYAYDDPIRAALIQQLEDYVDSQERLGEKRVENPQDLREFRNALETEKGLHGKIEEACKNIKDLGLQAAVKRELLEDLSLVREQLPRRVICIALDRLIARTSFHPIQSWHLYCEAARDPRLQQKAIRKWRAEGAMDFLEGTFMYWIYRFSTLGGKPMPKEEWLECMRHLSQLSAVLPETTAKSSCVTTGGAGAGGATDDCRDSSEEPMLGIARHLLKVLIEVPANAQFSLAQRITEQHEASSVKPLDWVGALQNLCAAVDDMFLDDASAVLRLSMRCDAIKYLYDQATTPEPAAGVPYTAGI